MPSASVSLYAPRAVTQVQTRYVGESSLGERPQPDAATAEMATDQKAGVCEEQRVQSGGEVEGESIPSEEQHQGERP